MMHGIKTKLTIFHAYFFPEDHTISLHHSHSNINALFYIRLGALVYLTGVYVWSMGLMGSLLSNIIYLTMQGYFLTWLYFLATMQDYMINGYGKWGRVFPLSNNLKYYIEVIFQMAFCLELPITLIFWGFLFRILIHMDGITPELIANNANIHAGPLICLCLDMAYNTFSFPKRHFLILLFFSLLYLIINLSYSLAIRPIYQPINWVSVLSYVLTVGALGLAYGMHCLGRVFFERWKKPLLDQRIVEGLIEPGTNSPQGPSFHEETVKNQYAKGDTPSDKDDEHNYSVITEDL